MGLLGISHVSQDTKYWGMRYAGMVWDYLGFPMYPGILSIVGLGMYAEIWYGDNVWDSQGFPFIQGY